MKIKKVKTKNEQLIITAMVTSSRFLREAQPILDTSLFKSKINKTISKWILDYFKENDQSPGVHIEDIYNTKLANGQIMEDQASMIEKTLSRLSKEYSRADKFNIDYVLTLAEEYLSSRYITKLTKHIHDNIEKDPEQAKEILETYQIPKLTKTKGYDLFRDKNLLFSAFEQLEQPLFKLKGALGDLVNNELRRGGFVALMGGEKIGKSWNLMEWAYTAHKQRCNVALFQAGDMGDLDQVMRVAIRLTGKPFRKQYCKNIHIPIYDCEYNQLGTCNSKKRKNNIELGMTGDALLEKIGKSVNERNNFFNEMDDDGYSACSYCRKKKPRSYKGASWFRVEDRENLTFSAAYKAMSKFSKRRSKRGFKLISYPNDSLTLDIVEAQINEWISMDAFVPDVLFFDYADIMVGKGKEYRHQQNSIWKGLRALSNKFNCLVITATQVSALAYGKRSLTLEHFSEDKRKYSHVTAMLSLNQLPHEKICGLIRVGVLLMRENHFDIRDQATVLQNYSIAHSHLGSYF